MPPRYILRHIRAMLRIYGPCTAEEIMSRTGVTRQGLEKAMELQIREGFAEQKGGRYMAKEDE